MTASTDNSEKKKNKKKGPIRWAAVAPALIFSLLVGLYGRYAFDSHLRKTIIFTGEYFYGAEINIANLKTSFLNGTLSISGIQLTDKEKPERNMVSVGHIDFNLNVKELLKAKFIVETGKVADIEWHGQRKSPGKVYPDRGDKSESLKKIEDTTIKLAQQNLQGNALGNVANVLGGSDVKTELKDIKSELSTEKKIKDLEKSLKEKQAYYKEKIKELKDSGKLKDLNKRIKTYKWNKKRPFKSLSEANKLIKDANSTYKLYNTEIRRLRDDVKTLDGTIKNVDKWIEEDMKNLQQMAGMPTLDPEKIAFSLFGEAFGGNVTEIRKYSEIAKEYMPPPKEERAENTLVPRKRGEGKDYTFEKIGVNPKLWIKKVSITSKANQSKFSGDLKGVITDISNSPRVTGKPILFTLGGDFPNQKLFGLDVKGELNHHLKEPAQRIAMKVKSFPFPKKNLAKGSDLGLSLMPQVGTLNLQGDKKGEKVAVKMNTSLPDPTFEVSAKKKLVKEIVSNSLKAMNEVTMRASATGTWEDLNWKFRSNIAKELSRGLKSEMNNQLQKAKQKLRQQLEAKIAPLKEKYKAEVDKVKNQLKSELKEQEDKIKNESKNSLNKIKSQQQNSSQKSIKKNTKKLEDKAKKLFKKLF